MVWTVLGSKRARGKKNRRNMKKLAARYPHTAVQMSRRRNLFGSGFTSLVAAAGAGFAAAGGFGAAREASLVVPAPGDFTGAAGRASSGFAIVYITLSEAELTLLCAVKCDYDSSLYIRAR